MRRETTLAALSRTLAEERGWTNEEALVVICQGNRLAEIPSMPVVVEPDGSVSPIREPSPFLALGRSFGEHYARLAARSNREDRDA